jgi:hypothetical protein
MKTENRELLGYTVPVVGIVETLAEAIAAAGSEAAVVKDYNNNVLAHSHFTILRRAAVIATLVKETGIKLKTKKVGDKDVIDEKESEYVARLESELGEETMKSFGSAIADTAAKIPVDYSPGTRGSGASATPAKKWLAYYDQLVTEDKLGAFCEKHSITGDDEESIKFAVANKVREIVTAKEKESARQALDV